MNTRQFANGTYEEIGNTIIPAKKKSGFILKLNIYAILLIIVLVIPTGFLFEGFSIVVQGTTYYIYILIFMVLFLAFIVIHELLHGLSFVLFGKVTIAQLKFGVILKSGMAYCISTVPVQVKASRISLMMPVYAICMPLYIAGVILNIPWISILAILFVSGSVADFYYIWLLRKTDKNLYIFEEMPTKSGYEVGYRLYKKCDE